MTLASLTNHIVRLWGPTSLPLSDRILRLFVKSAVCGVLFHVMPCWLWFIPSLSARLTTVTLFLLVNSAARLVYSARSKHIGLTIAPRAPLVESSRADQISATYWLIAAFMTWRCLTLLGAFTWRLTLTLAAACVLLTQPAHTGRIIHWSLNARRPRGVLKLTDLTLADQVGGVDIDGPQLKQ